MKLLKMVAIFCAVFAVGILFRGGLRRVTPRFYDRIWGTGKEEPKTKAVATSKDDVVDAAKSLLKSKTKSETKEEAPPYVTGYAVFNRRVNVTFSDGTMLTEEDKELEQVQRASVRVSGVKLRIQPHVILAGAVGGPPVASGVIPTAASAAVPAAEAAGKVAGGWRLDWDGVWRLTTIEHLGGN